MGQTITKTIEVQVNAHSDNPIIKIVDGNCNAVYYGQNYTVGINNVSSSTYYNAAIRFASVAIPKNATILSAYLKFISYSNFYGTEIYSFIQGEKSPNPSTFSDCSDYDSRTRTSTSLSWGPIPEWYSNNEYLSPNLKDIIQEIINQNDWEQGNAIVLFWDVDHENSDTGVKRQGHSYWSDPSKAIKLEVTYSVPVSWLEGWSYRKSHVIEPASGAGANYQVKIKVHYGNGTDSGEDVYLNRKCRTDFGDIRFTASDGTTELNYWMEKKVEGDYAIFWVKIAEDLNSSDVTIHIYYGNSDATYPFGDDQAKMDATFLFADHFYGTNLDTNKWTIEVDGDYISVSDSKLVIERKPSPPAAIKGKVLLGVNTASESYAYSSHSDAGLNSIVNAYVNKDNYDDYIWQTLENTDIRSASRKNGSASYSFVDGPFDWEKPTRFTIKREAARLRFYVNGSLIRTFTNTDYIPTIDMVSFLRGSNTTSKTLYVDYIFYRKYVDPEPSHGSWGSEESQNWLKGWLYRKSHVINGATGAGTLYPVKIKTHFGSGTDSAENVYLSGHCRQDFGDVRFTDFSGTLQLDYWMEEVQNGDYAIFWVEIRGDLNYDQTIFVYYGKNDATTTSNGEATFLFFDHFLGDSLNEEKWTPSGAITVSSSVVKIGTSNGDLLSIPTFSSNVRVRSYMQMYGGYFLYAQMLNATASDAFGESEINISPSRNCFIENNGNFNYESITRNVEIFQLHEWQWLPTKVNFFINDELQKTFSVTLDPPMNLNFKKTKGQSTPYIKVDWVFVAKFVDPEPSHGSWGEEEKGFLYETLELSFSMSDNFLVEIKKTLDLSISFKEETKKTLMVSIFFGQYIVKSLLKRIFIRIFPDKNKDCKK